MKNPVIWFEVIGQDADKIKTFYQEMFAWPLEKAPAMDYHMLQKPEEGIPGGVGAAPKGAKGWSTFYVKVDDVNTYLERAERLGAKTLMPRQVLPDGMAIAVFADPEGNPVGILSDT